jgi:ribonucleoside-diphosphate reductase alpha chain
MSGKEQALAPPAEAAPAATTVEALNNTIIVKGAVRSPLPKVRPAKTYSFTVADCHGYFTVGEYEDGAPGELFVSVAKMGSTLSGLMDSFGRSISYGLQYGVPLKVYVKGMTAMSFAPAGITDDKEIRTAASLVDYIFRRLATDYLSFDDRLELGLASFDDMPTEQTSLLSEEAGLKVDSQNTQQVVNVGLDAPATEVKPIVADVQTSLLITTVDGATSKVAKKSVIDHSAPMCYNCGNQTQKAGSCYVCTSCGSTTGCS